MPEGHTLHRLALDLDRAFAGTRPRVSSPQGRFDAGAALLDQRLAEGFSAWGKHLFGEFEGERVLHVHLGLIGTFRIEPPHPAVGQVRLRIATADDPVAAGEDPTARVADLRGPQVCAVRTPDEIAAVCAGLGPDPLRSDADPDQAWRRIHRSGRSIGELLMDQSVLAGVGNVYRAEVLFRNRINPRTPGDRLKPASWRAIWADLLELMPLGVRDNRIDTVRLDHSPEAMGRPARTDDHGGEVYVYRRNGQPCLVCGREVRTAVLAGRNLFWCATCQRRS